MFSVRIIERYDTDVVRSTYRAIISVSLLNHSNINNFPVRLAYESSWLKKPFCSILHFSRRKSRVGFRVNLCQCCSFIRSDRRGRNMPEVTRKAFQYSQIQLYPGRLCQPPAVLGEKSDHFRDLPAGEQLDLESQARWGRNRGQNVAAWIPKFVESF